MENNLKTMLFLGALTKLANLFATHSLTSERATRLRAMH